jgi:zinc transport system ATP-binding protein
MNPLIHIENLTVGYDRKPVLSNVTLQVFDNDFIGVIGPNGGGKTTLLKAILGLIQPFEGKITFRNDIDNDRKPIGYLPQVKNIDHRFPITVFDVVASGLMMSTTKETKLARKQRINDLLAETGIIDISHKAIGELSGGQMQRVFLCRAIISNPKVLILDEPDTFVDNRFEGELYQKLEKLNQNMAVILVSHDVGTIAGYVKTIACVNGRLHYHSDNKITQEQLDEYDCPLHLISHGKVPLRILNNHIL